MQIPREALGNIAKSVDVKSGHRNDFVFNGSIFDDVSEQEILDSILLARENKWKLKSAVERLLPGTRYCACHKYILPAVRNGDGDLVNGRQEVSIYKHKDTDSVFFGGLETCGSVWSCPLCAAKISERRRKELELLNTFWQGDGKKIFLMTFTFPHGKYDVLADLLERFSSARKRFFASRAWRYFKSANGIKHSVYCLETTYGENGWHIHVHMILLVDNLQVSNMKPGMMLHRSWQESCVREGLGKPNKHGLDIRAGSEAFNYISKWGIDLELTKQHTKHGINGSKTPFDLLRDFSDGDEIAGDLFVEFSRAFKGKRQLVWSKNLKKEIGLNEISDSELAEEKTEDADLLVSINRKEWDLVVKYDFRNVILQEARQNGKDGVRQFLKILICGECREKENNSFEENILLTVPF